MPSTIRSCSERHSCFIASHSARASSRSPRLIASIALSIVGRDISRSSSSSNHRSPIAFLSVDPTPEERSMPKVLYEKRDRIAYVTLNRPEAAGTHTTPLAR